MQSTHLVIEDSQRKCVQHVKEILAETKVWRINETQDHMYPIIINLSGGSFLDESI
jgi:hypothetical protein